VSVGESITQRCKYDIVMKHKAACGVAPNPTSCGIFKGAKSQYDLSSLTTPVSSPWHGVDGQYTYYWNFCVNLDGVPPEVATTGPVAAVQILTGYGVASPVGLLSGYEIWERAPNVISVRYMAGRPEDLCARTIARNTTITIECSPGSDGAVVSISEPAMCKYEIVMKHKAACATGPTPPTPTLPLCCVYNYAANITTFCTVDSECPVLKDLKFEGQFRVDTCTSCKKGFRL